MDIEKFTERARGFIQAAQSLATREHHQQIAPLHLLKVLMDDEEGLASRLIQAGGGRPDVVRQEIESALAKIPKVEGSGAGQVYLAADTARVLDSAQELAKKAGDSFVTVELILLALAMAGGTDAGHILKDANLRPQNLNKAIKDLRQGRTADTASA